MVKYTHAAYLLLMLSLSASSTDGFLSPTPIRCRSSITSMRRNVSASTFGDGGTSSKSNDIGSNMNGEQLRTAVENIGASYMETMSEAIQWDDEENDQFEARVIELKKKRMQQRFGTSIQNTVQLSFKSDINIGMVLGQIDPGMNLFDKALDMDTLQYNQRAASSSKNDDIDVLLHKSVDGAFKGVIVLSVDPNGQGWEAGIRPGNVLTASSATVGEAMWPKATLEGVQSAIASRKVVSSTLGLSFQQQQKKTAVKVDNHYELSLSRPIGIEVGEDKDGYVVVTRFNENASKLVRNAVLEGDRIVAVASTLGDRLWPVSTVEGVISACTARLPGQKVTMQFERPLINLEKAAAAVAASMDSNQVVASTALPSVDVMTQVDPPMAPEKITRLLKGCREVLRRYPAPEKKRDDNNNKNFVEKYAVPAMVADKVIDAVASASTSFDAPTLSMVMNAFLSCDQASGAIRIFEAATGMKADGSSDAVETMIMGKDKGVLVASPDALNLYTASSLMSALASNGDISSAKRILAALEGQGGTIVDKKEVAVWPGTGEAGAIVPDVMCYNIALKAASMAVDGLADLLSIFTSMSDGKQDGTDLPAKDIVSYNTVIVALTNADRTKDAFDMFSRMKNAGIKPDKFTYTSLIKACSQPIDMQELLYEMEEKGVKPDIVTYNTMIRTLCSRLQWFEAKKLIYDMECNGIAPNSMTYGFLMSGLMKAEKYSAALILFESACADSRTTPLTENVQLYTSAIAAAASLRNHEKAFHLINRMNMAGVKPNLQTMTAVMCSCLSSGVTNLAVEVYKKIDKPDGIAMSKGLEAMCHEGQFEEVVTTLYAQWRTRSSVMSGKQIMQGYNLLLRQALQQGNLSFARTALTQFLQMGFIPSKAMYLTIIESLNLVPPKKKDLPFAKDVPEENFDFLLFVLDITRGRNLAIDGFFYSCLLACSARMGPLRRKVGSLMAEARALSNSDAALLVKNEGNSDGRAAHAEVGWEDLLRNYDEYKEQNSILPPRLSVNISKALVRSVLFAEQLVTYNGVNKSSSSSRRTKKPTAFAGAATN